MTVRIAAFYKFVRLDDCEALAASLKQLCVDADIIGTILVAREGLNGTVCGSEHSIDQLLAFINADPRLEGISVKLATSDVPVFRRLKVKLRSEIVTLHHDVDAAGNTGTRVSPQDWNALISDPNVVVVDTRNDYEVEIGSFSGAIDPKTESFGDFPTFVDKALAADKSRPIAMFCTGGIRCEKASAYLRESGFENVFQLDGGILKYLETVKQEDSLWEGACFVFDRRVSVTHGLARGPHALCISCGNPFVDDRSTDQRPAIPPVCVQCRAPSLSAKTG